MNGLLKAIVLGMVRTFAAGLVPSLIAAGVLQQNQANDFIGAACFFGTLAFSAFDKYVVNRKITVAAATGEIPAKVDMLSPPPPPTPPPPGPQATMNPIPNP